MVCLVDPGCQIILVVRNGVQDTVGMLLLVCLEDAVDFFVNIFGILDLFIMVILAPIS